MTVAEIAVTVTGVVVIAVPARFFFRATGCRDAWATGDHATGDRHVATVEGGALR